MFDANLNGLPNLESVKIDQINSFDYLMLPETYNADIYFNGNIFQEFMWKFHCLANNNWAVEEITIYVVYIDVSVTGIGPVLAGFHILSLILAVFSCDQAALWMVQSVRLSVRLSVCPSVRPSVCHTFLTMFPSSYHHEIFRSYYQWQKWRPCKRSRSEVKGRGHRGHNPT